MGSLTKRTIVVLSYFRAALVRGGLRVVCRIGMLTPDTLPRCPPLLADDRLLLPRHIPDKTRQREPSGRAQAIVVYVSNDVGERGAHSVERDVIVLLLLLPYASCIPISLGRTGGVKSPHHQSLEQQLFEFPCK